MLSRTSQGIRSSMHNTDVIMFWALFACCPGHKLFTSEMQRVEGSPWLDPSSSPFSSLVHLDVGRNGFNFCWVNELFRRFYNCSCNIRSYCPGGGLRLMRLVQPFVNIVRLMMMTTSILRTDHWEKEKEISGRGLFNQFVSRVCYENSKAAM